MFGPAISLSCVFLALEGCGGTNMAPVEDAGAPRDTGSEDTGTANDSGSNPPLDAGAGDPIGGSITLSAGVTVTLQLNGGNDVVRTESGTFTFPGSLASGTEYTVTATTTADAVNCTVVSGTGTYEDTPVRNVLVTCGPHVTFVVPGTYQWLVPNGVTSVSVVAVGAGGGGGSVWGQGAGGGGGGELCYRNDIPVEPGTMVTVTVGAGGEEAYSDDPTTGCGCIVNGLPGCGCELQWGGIGGASSFGADLTANGGMGFYWDPIRERAFPGFGGQGSVLGTCGVGGTAGANASGGGAAGYGGPGGAAGGNSGTVSAGMAGGGGGGDFGRGGNVGLTGQGANGAAGDRFGTGAGGDGSSDGTQPVVGGGGGSHGEWRAGRGSNGGVRIMWGTNRAYPATNTGDVF